METHVTRQPVPGELSQHVLAVLPGSHLFSAAEQVWAYYSSYACEAIARLMRCSASVWVARREAEAAHQLRRAL